MGDHEIKPADTVVGMFVKQNKNRAKQSFQSRSAKYNISRDRWAFLLKYPHFRTVKGQYV